MSSRPSFSSPSTSFPSVYAVIPPGKERVKRSKFIKHVYPIILLLGLLDRSFILRTPSIVASMVNVLEAVTLLLASHSDKKKEDTAKAAVARASPTSGLQPSSGDQVSQPSEPLASGK